MDREAFSFPFAVSFIAPKSLYNRRPTRPAMSKRRKTPSKPPKVRRQERSAGVILFRADPNAFGGRLFLLLDYGRYWEYPKGHVERAESDEQAALREVEEETGIADVQLLPGFAHPITYFFYGPKGPVRKTVIFFLASTSTAAVRISHEHVGYAWLSAPDALARLKYPTSKQLLEKALRFIVKQK